MSFSLAHKQSVKAYTITIIHTMLIVQQESFLFDIIMFLSTLCLYSLHC